MEPFDFYYYAPNKPVLEKYIFETRILKNHFYIYVENFFYSSFKHLCAHHIILIGIGAVKLIGENLLKGLDMVSQLNENNFLNI